MASETITFDTEGQATGFFFLQPGDAVNWTLTPDGNFVGTIIFEKTLDGITTIELFRRVGTAGVPIDAEDTGTHQNETSLIERVRFRLSAIDVASDDLDATIDDVEEVFAGAQLRNGVIQGPGGNVLLTVKEASIDIPVLTGGSGDGDFSAGALLLPQGTTPAQTAEGSTFWDTNDNLLSVGTGSGRKTYVDTDSTQSISGKTYVNPTFSGPIAGNATTLRSLILNSSAKAGAGAGWVVGAANDLGILATIPAGVTAGTLVIPVTCLGVGDIITRFYLIGQIESGGNACTLDCQLRVLTAVAADNTDALVEAATQISVTADTLLDDNTSDLVLASPRTVDILESYYLLLTATTAAATDISLLGVVLNYTRPFNNAE